MKWDETSNNDRRAGDGVAGAVPISVGGDWRRETRSWLEGSKLWGLPLYNLELRIVSDGWRTFRLGAPAAPLDHSGWLSRLRALGVAWDNTAPQAHHGSEINEWHSNVKIQIEALAAGYRRQMDQYHDSGHVGMAPWNSDVVHMEIPNRLGQIYMEGVSEDGKSGSFGNWTSQRRWWGDVVFLSGFHDSETGSSAFAKSTRMFTKGRHANCTACCTTAPDWAGWYTVVLHVDISQKVRTPRLRAVFN